MPDPSMAKVTSMHFYAWESGLKTGKNKKNIYVIRYVLFEIKTSCKPNKIHIGRREFVKRCRIDRDSIIKFEEKARRKGEL